MAERREDCEDNNSFGSFNGCCKELAMERTTES